MASKHLKKPDTSARPGDREQSPGNGDEEIYAARPKTSERRTASEASSQKGSRRPGNDPVPISVAGPRPRRSEPIFVDQPEAREEPATTKDARRTTIMILIAVLLLVALICLWAFRDRFNKDDLVLSTTAVAQEEYVFDVGSGQVFAAAGPGLAIATTSGMELLDGNGTMVMSQVFQMAEPAIAACDDFAVFYDLGGTNIAVAYFDGSVGELVPAGNIFSITVSSGGYITVTTQATGYRGLVTVYDSDLEAVYQWYSSSAWLISASVSPDGRKLAVLSYTSSGSEVHFFNLNQTEEQAVFTVSGEVLLDVSWSSSNQLCSYSTSKAYFFNAEGQTLNTYDFGSQYLAACTFDGDGLVTFALSPYRAGTTSVLVSLDSTGKVLGTADLQSELISLTASGSEILALCSDSALLYSSSLSLKGQLTGLVGFKYGLIRNKGEALMIASSYAEVYDF